MFLFNLYTTEPAARYVFIAHQFLRFVLFHSYVCVIISKILLQAYTVKRVRYYSTLDTSRSRRLFPCDFRCGSIKMLNLFRYHIVDCAFIRVYIGQFIIILLSSWLYLNKVQSAHKFSYSIQTYNFSVSPSIPSSVFLYSYIRSHYCLIFFYFFVFRLSI